MTKPLLARVIQCEPAVKTGGYLSQIDIQGEPLCKLMFTDKPLKVGARIEAAAGEDSWVLVREVGR